MNSEDKAKYRRYMSLCSKRMLHEMTKSEDLTEAELDELRSLKQELGGDHKEILAIAKSILTDDVTGS